MSSFNLSTLRFLLGVALMGCSSTPEPEDKPSPAVLVVEQVPEAPLAPEKPAFRLAPSVVPQTYQLNFTLDPASDGFSGHAIIQIDLGKPTQSFFIHNKKLNISEVTFQGANKTLKPTWNLFPKEEQMGVFFDEVLPPQTATLEIKFSGHYGKELKGLYKFSHESGDYLFSQMEPISARSLFPCFDEPHFKTPFRINLTVPKDLIAITNMPQIDESAHGEAFVTKKFLPSPPLPTYLVAILVGPFDEVVGPSIPATQLRTSPIPLRGFSLKGKGEQLQHALKNTGSILLALENYFGMAHPYPKIDIIAVPDFGAGAMENPGAITFREWLLLLDEKSATVQQKRAFTGVMAHELVHQWFGNLVTLAWWDDLWLNEAFATFLGHKITAEVSPQSLALEQLVKRTHSAMNSDSIPSARQIRQPIDSHHDIHNAFDGITYSKGAGFLSMLEGLLGEENFQKAIGAFLRQNAEGIATVDDLLHALEAQGKQPISQVAKSFLNQPGVPTLDFDLSCNAETNHIRVGQRRYFKMGLAPETNDQLWNLPFCFKTNADDKTCLTLQKKQDAFKQDVCPDFLFPNAAARGYFRFKLAQDLSDKLVAKLDALTLPEKLALADSLKSSFWAGELPFEELMPYMKRYGKMPQRILSTAFVDVFDFAHDHVWAQKPPKKFSRFIRKIYAKPFQKIGFLPLDGESEDIKIQRQAYFDLLYTHDAPGIHRWLYKRGLRLLKAKNKGGKTDFLQPELRWLALHAVITKGTTKANKYNFSRIISMLPKETDSSWRRIYISVLGQTPELANFEQILALLPGLRKNEKTSLLWSLMANPIFMEATWNVFQKRYEEWKTEIPEGSLAYTPYLATSFCDQNRVDELTRFFEDRLKNSRAPRNSKATEH